MTKEEKEAIKILNTISEKEQGQRVFWEEDLKNIRIVLNLIQKQQKQLEKLENKNKDLIRKLRNRVKEVKKLTKYSLYKKEFSRLNKEIEKKNKMIDEISKNPYNELRVNGILFTGTDIKQYFEK